MEMGEIHRPSQENAPLPAWIVQLASGLVHEMKNPLSTINLNLQLLQEEFEGVGENGRRRRILKKIEVLMEEVERLDNILNDFLRFSRSQKLEKGLYCLNRAVEEVLDFIEPEAFQQGVKILKQFDLGLPRMLFDRNLVKQAVLNLVLNALQAMPEGGELIVETQREGGRAVIEVTDTGVGIPQERLDKIWEVYYSSKNSGTGLGLPTVLRVVQAHGGEIQVQTEEGKGSQFRVYLPIVEEEGSDEG